MTSKKLLEENKLMKEEVEDLRNILEKKKDAYNTFYKLYNDTRVENKQLQWEVYRLGQRIEALEKLLQESKVDSINGLRRKRNGKKKAEEAEQKFR